MIARPRPGPRTTWGGSAGGRATSPGPASRRPRSAGLRLLELLLAQLDPPDLARQRLGQRVDELDPPRVRVRAEPLADVALDLLRQLVARLRAGGEDDERLDHVPAPLVRRRDRRGLGDRRVLEAGGLDLERADPVARRDDHVVGPALVPDVAVLVLARGVLGVEPLPAERLAARRLVVPVAEGIVRVRPRAQADLAALAARHGALVLVEDAHIPAGHRPPHRALADLHEREVRDERIGLRQPVEVEHRDAVLGAEPADRLGVQRLAGAADDPELLRVARARVADAH